MLDFLRGRDRAVIETTSPWAFRQGDLVTRDQMIFEITRVKRRSTWWLTPGRRADRFVVYGTPVQADSSLKKRAINASTLVGAS
jgi:hypothetical protein